MLIQAVFSVDTPKGADIEALVPKGPGWTRFEGDEERFAWMDGQHRALQGNMDLRRLGEILDRHGLYSLDEIGRGRPIRLSGESREEIVRLYLFPEEGSDPAEWEILLGVLRRVPSLRMQMAEAN